MTDESELEEFVESLPVVLESVESGEPTVPQLKAPPSRSSARVKAGVQKPEKLREAFVGVGGKARMYECYHTLQGRKLCCLRCTKMSWLLIKGVERTLAFIFFSLKKFQLGKISSEM